MPAAAEHPAPVSAADVDVWLAELGIVPVERGERDGIASWDLVLDGRRRRDVRVTLILDPSLAMVGWVHFAPPLADSFRKSYRQFLRWNDELPFVKFALSSDERPILSAELPTASVDGHTAGLMLARLIGVCDLLVDESAHWLWPGTRQAPEPKSPGRNERLLDRYAEELAELSAPAEEFEDSMNHEGS